MFSLCSSDIQSGDGAGYVTFLLPFVSLCFSEPVAGLTGLTADVAEPVAAAASSVEEDGEFGRHTVNVTAPQRRSLTPCVSCRRREQQLRRTREDDVQLSFSQSSEPRPLPSEPCTPASTNHPSAKGSSEGPDVQETIQNQPPPDMTKSS